MIIVTFTEAKTNIVHAVQYDIDIDLTNKAAVITIIALLPDLLQAVSEAQKNGMLSNIEVKEVPIELKNGQLFWGLHTKN